MDALVLKGLSKVYRNGVEALKGIDLVVREGDFFALLGPNGAGKTTAIGIITSLIRKSSGSVSVFGYDIERDREAAKSCIGVVPQEINLNMFERNDNTLVNQAGYYGVPAGVAKARTEKYLKALHLWDRRLDVARTLSGGMKRRLMIARALVHEPRLLILDEPTAGVDIEIRRSMWDFMREINAAGVTIILTTHYLEEAESLCRNIAIIDEGRIIENDTMANVIGKLQLESFVLSLRSRSAGRPMLNGYAVRLRNDREIEVDVAKGQGLNQVFARAFGAVAARREHANEDQPARRAVHQARRGQGGGRANERRHEGRAAARAAPPESAQDQPHGPHDDRAQGVAPRRPNLDSDDRAAGHHDDPVLHHLRQPRRQPDRRRWTACRT